MFLDYDPQYEAYCFELQKQAYLESPEFLEVMNKVLQDIRISELEELI